MKPEEDGGSEARFSAYVERLSAALGHRDRVGPFRGYCAGLLGTEGRKSVEPLAATTAPSRVSRQHQSLLHLVGQSEWSDAAVLAQVRADVLPAMERHGTIEAWILDDTSFPKQGRHSVGVARQYCGQLGKRANCQTAVTLSLANHHASLPVGYRLYLPKEWAEDEPRRKQAGVPDEVVFETKMAIALGLLEQALAQDVPRGFVLTDAGYGSDTAFREAVTALGLPYIMGVGPTTSVWPPDVRPLAQTKPRRGPPLLRLRRDDEREPISVKELALNLPERHWQVVEWREGSNDVLKGRFARVRVHAAHRDNLRSELRPEEWLIVEWPETEAEPTKYWLSTLPPDIPFDQLVDAVKLRWRIERDYQELKQEVGLGHYEGRGWRGFHHHAILCIAAYGFLIAEKETIPPSGHPGSRRFKASLVSYRPGPTRSSLATRASRPKLNRNATSANSCCPGTRTPEMSLLPPPSTYRRLMTQ
ncbi:MAG: IS701 family transposase [Steroidobacteraceae bacterium]